MAKIELSEIAPQELREQAARVLAINSEQREYLQEAARSLGEFDAITREIGALRATLQHTPDASRMRELLGLVAMKNAFLEVSGGLFFSADSFGVQLRARHPDMPVFARELCQGVVNICHPLLGESQADDARHAAELEIEGVESARTKSLRSTIDLAVTGTWTAATSLATKISGKAVTHGNIPEHIR